MKKLFVVLTVAAFAVSFASCSKTCSCTEANTGKSESNLLSVLGVKEYKNCKEMAKGMNNDKVLDDNGNYVTANWSCK